MKRWAVMGSAILVLSFLAGCNAAIERWLGSGYSTNGERIYFTATSDRGTPISYRGGPGMPGMMRGRLACVICHGPDGRGGRTFMMMRSIEAPDIRYRTLTQEMEHEEGEAHPPYIDELIVRAITQGLDPAGNPLDWSMPRWSMSEEDLNDLLEFLKSLP
ncbi:MAG: c-type cytochrome [Chloroflexi bacterium]|nr:c-type cytochrome [Chloroflexota bacterium]